MVHRQATCPSSITSTRRTKKSTDLTFQHQIDLPTPKRRALFAPDKYHRRLEGLHSTKRGWRTNNCSVIVARDGRDSSVRFNQLETGCMLLFEGVWPFSAFPLPLPLGLGLLAPVPVMILTLLFP